MADWPGLPDKPVLDDEDMLQILDLSLSTYKRRIRQKVFPIPELLPRLDRRRRYSRADVIAYLAREDGGRVAAPQRKSA